jgi:hypothetical protein
LPPTDQFKEGAWSDPLSRNQLGATIVDLSKAAKAAKAAKARKAFARSKCLAPAGAGAAPCSLARVRR